MTTASLVEMSACDWASGSRNLYFVPLACASLVGLVACDDTGSPVRRSVVPHDGATPPGEQPTAAGGDSELERATGPKAAASPQPNRACAAGVTMPLGNTYASL